MNLDEFIKKQNEKNNKLKEMFQEIVNIILNDSRISNIINITNKSALELNSTSYRTPCAHFYFQKKDEKYVCDMISLAMKNYNCYQIALFKNGTILYNDSIGYETLRNYYTINDIINEILRISNLKYSDYDESHDKLYNINDFYNNK